jgi:glucose/arabinose dehydrogenase
MGPLSREALALNFAPVSHRFTLAGPVFVRALCGCACAAGAACSPLASPSDGVPIDATVDSSGSSSSVSGSLVDASPEASLADPCSLPGSIQFTSSGVVVVSGGGAAPDLSFLTLPQGFCAHYYGTVGSSSGGNARQMRFAPSGELFVSSPTTGTTGGNGGAGLAAIVVLPDDNHDGVADSVLTFLSSLPSTQGMLFANDQFYYQDGTQIMSVPYESGDRSPRGPSTQVANITIYTSSLHWPKTLDIADDGTIYVGNGGDQSEVCDPTRPFHGGILKLDGTDGGDPVAKGFRNPINVRCTHGHNLCFAIELGLDYSADEGGHEKLVPIHQGDDWGFPCCATQNVPFPGGTAAICANVTPDTDSFLIGNTPFGVDFESGMWPAPWTGSAFIVTHGAAGTWAGARMVAIAMDPTTGLPMPASDVDGADTGAMRDFATGWDDGTLRHGRPSAVTFSSDGRLFVANDQNGVIFWIAPMQD